MSEHDAVTQIRIAVARRDHVDLVRLLTLGPWPPYTLHLIGGGLVDAVTAGADGAQAAATKCVAVLRERGWDGDDELAIALEAAYGAVPHPDLRPLPVDLEELSSSLEGDPLNGGGQIDLMTGAVWPNQVLDDMPELRDDEDSERWLWFDSMGSRAGYHDMVDFLGLVDDERLAGRLSRALEGRGAFRRFKGALSDRPELLQLYFLFSDERKAGRARAFLADQGYTPVSFSSEESDEQ